MFIASSTTPDRAPFGGAECYSMNTCQLEFRPSERRRMDGGGRPINISPYGVATWPHDLARVYSKKSAQENKKLTICFTD